MTRTGNGTPAEDVTDWITVVQLLFAAAERGFAEAAADPRRHSTAMGTYTAAAQALALLPAGLDFDDAAVAGDMATLVVAADRAARRQPVEGQPAGASQVIAAIGDLIRESSR